MPLFTQPIHEHGDPSRTHLPYPHAAGGHSRAVPPRQLGGSLRVESDQYGVVELAFEVGGEIVGHASFHAQKFQGHPMAEIDYIGIKKSLRGRGYGNQLYRALGNTLVRRGFQYIGGEVTSAGVLKLRNKVFGEPVYVGDAIKTFTVGQALQRLPARSPENDEGIIDSADHVFVAHKLRRKY